MTKKVPLFIVLGALLSVPLHMAHAVTINADNAALYRIDPSRIKPSPKSDSGDSEEKLFQFVAQPTSASADSSADSTEVAAAEPKPTIRIVRKITPLPLGGQQTEEDSKQIDNADEGKPDNAQKLALSVPAAAIKTDTPVDKPAVETKAEKPAVRKLDVAAYQRDTESAVSKSRAVQRAVSYTVRGKRYTTLADSEGFVQTGRASWYGQRFHGRKTASGERFDMNAMTAAHKRLPLGSKIEVTNNANGKKVIVTVNDRGPFHGNRVLDLSKAAAQELGVIKAGTAEVTIRAL